MTTHINDLTKEQREEVMEFVEALKKKPMTDSEIELLFGHEALMKQKIVALNNNLITCDKEFVGNEPAWSATERGNRFLNSDIDFDELLRQFDTLTVVKTYCKSHPVLYNDINQFYFWNTKELRYKQCDEIDLMVTVGNSSSTGGYVDSKVRNEILESFRQVGREKFRSLKEVPLNWIQCKNEIINFETMERFEPSPEYFMPNIIPWKCGISIETPVMDKWFNYWVSPNTAPSEDYQRIIEWLTFQPYRKYSPNRILNCVGSGGNGKGVFTRLMIKLYGEENFAFVDIEKLVKSKFHKALLLNKFGAIAGETNFSNLDETKVIKTISGDDLTSGEFKGKPEFTFRPFAKLTVCSNSLPPTADKTDGWARRQLFLDFNTQTEIELDILAEVPDKEYENMLFRCISGINTLIKNGKFAGEGSIKDRAKQYEDKSNYLSAFVRDFCVQNPNFYEPAFEFRNKFEKHCIAKGLRMMSPGCLTKAMKELGFEYVQKRICMDDMEDQNMKVWYGLSVKSEEEIIRDALNNTTKK